MPASETSRCPAYSEDPFEVGAKRHKSQVRATPSASDDDVTSGLDRREDESHRRRRRLDPMSAPAPIGDIALLVLGWQCLVWARVKPEWALPPVSDIGSALWRAFTSGDAVSAIWVSLRRSVLGFFAALVIGAALGRLVGRAAVQSLPSVAWVPFSTMIFYLIDTTIYMVILLSAVPSIAMGLIGWLD